jgi:hypothetical protein
VPAGLKVSLESNPALSGITRAGGSFEIPNVPFGDHKLVISGKIPNTKYDAQGELAVQLPNLSAFRQVFEIEAAMDLSTQEPEG